MPMRGAKLSGFDGEIVLGIPGSPGTTNPVGAPG